MRPMTRCRNEYEKLRSPGVAHLLRAALRHKQTNSLCANRATQIQSTCYWALYPTRVQCLVTRALNLRYNHHVTPSPVAATRRASPTSIAIAHMHDTRDHMLSIYMTHLRGSFTNKKCIKNKRHHSTGCWPTCRHLEKRVVCGALLPCCTSPQRKSNKPVPPTYLTRFYTHVMITLQNGAPRERASHLMCTPGQARANVSHGRDHTTRAGTKSRHQNGISNKRVVRN